MEFKQILGKKKTIPKIWIQNKFVSKNSGSKNFRSKESLVQKIQNKKKELQKTHIGEIKFEAKKILGTKKFWVQNIFGSKQFGLKKIRSKMFGKKNVVQKIWVKEFD